MTATTKATGGLIEQTVKENQLAEAKKNPQLKDWVLASSKALAMALPKVITPERFSRIVLTALQTTPKLAECEPKSFLGAMMNAAQLGLEPNSPLGQAYLLPYNNNKKGVVECQFQIGYKGLLDLAYRSGEITTIQAHVVYKNDTFEYELGLEPKLRHIPAFGDRGEPIYVYAMFKLKNGGTSFTVSSIDDIRKHAQKYSKSYSFGPWQTNFEEMAKKTVIKQLLKYAPIRSDFIMAATSTDEKTLNISDLSDDATVTVAEVKDEAPEGVDAETGEVKG